MARASQRDKKLAIKKEPKKYSKKEVKKGKKATQLRNQGLKGMIKLLL